MGHVTMTEMMLALAASLAWAICGAIGHYCMCREMEVTGAEFYVSMGLVYPLGPFGLLLALAVRATRPE